MSPEDLTDIPIDIAIDIAERLSTLRPIPTRYGNNKGMQLAKAVNLNDMLPFVALSVSVDNFTQDWLHLPDANLWVPPFVTGARYLIVPGSNHATARWETPPGGANSVNADLGTIANLTWYSDPLPEIAGLQLHAI